MSDTITLYDTQVIACMIYSKPLSKIPTHIIEGIHGKLTGAAGYWIMVNASRVANSEMVRLGMIKAP